MSCRRGSWDCPRYKQKDEFERAKRQFPSIQSDIENWNCNVIYEKTCKDFQPVPPRMTAEEFNAKQDELLSELPIEFRCFVSSYAYDCGHSAGYEEIIGYVAEMVSELKEPIKNYTDKVVKIASNVKSFK